MKTVMLVDDAAFLRLHLRQMLENYQYRIIAEAENGEEAIRYNDLYKPDIIFMDITMPIMDGIAASETILKENPSAKIIMCSALSYREMVVKLYRMGVKDFVAKPFHPERVKRALDNLAWSTT